MNVTMEIKDNSGIPIGWVEAIELKYYLKTNNNGPISVGSLMLLTKPQEGFMCAEGQSLEINQYPDLYQAVGDSYCPKKITKTYPPLKRFVNYIFRKPLEYWIDNPEYKPGFFNLPDMRPHDQPPRRKGFKAVSTELETLLGKLKKP